MIRSARRVAISLGAALAAAGCGDYGGPSNPGAAWALARVGESHLPVDIGGGGTPLLLVADTLILDQARVHSQQAILTHVAVEKLGEGAPLRIETRHSYAVVGDMLTFDSCPVDVFCAAASLVYAPLTFHIVGDSLFQIITTPTATENSVAPRPYVYGRVRF